MHLAVFADLSVPNTLGTHKIPAVVDGYLNAQDGSFILPRTMSLLRNAGLATVFGRMYLSHPEFRNIGFHDVTNVATSVANINLHYQSSPDLPELAVTGIGGLSCHYVRSTLGAAVVAYPLIVGDRRPHFASGRIRNIHYSATVDATAGLWSNARIATTEPLPFGVYNVLGAFFYSQTAGFARLWFNNQQERPGSGVGISSNSQYDSRLYYGETCLWGKFSVPNLPVLQFLSLTTATVSLTGIIQLEKTSG